MGSGSFKTKTLMKKSIAIFLISVVLAGSLFSQPRSTKGLTGRWAGISLGKKASLEFIDSMHVNVTFPDGKFLKAVYIIDFAKDPVWFDIINVQKDQKSTLEGLIRFTDNNTLRWMITHDGTRPKGFSPNKNTSIQTFKRENPHL